MEHSGSSEPLVHDENVRDLAYHPNGSLFAVAGTGGELRLWDVASRVETRALAGHTGTVKAVSFSPDGGLLASGGEDHVVRLWNVAGGVPAGELVGHPGEIEAVAFAPEGRTLAVGALTGTVTLWDVAGRTVRAGPFRGTSAPCVTSCSLQTA